MPRESRNNQRGAHEEEEDCALEASRSILQRERACLAPDAQGAEGSRGRRADQEAVDGPDGGRPAADLEERAVARTKERADVERESDESRRVDEVV